MITQGGQKKVSPLLLPIVKRQLIITVCASYLTHDCDCYKTNHLWQCYSAYYQTNTVGAYCFWSTLYTATTMYTASDNEISRRNKTCKQ